MQSAWKLSLQKRLNQNTRRDPCGLREKRIETNFERKQAVQHPAPQTNYQVYGTEIPNLEESSDKILLLLKNLIDFIKLG